LFSTVSDLSLDSIRVRALCFEEPQRGYITFGLKLQLDIVTSLAAEQTKFGAVTLLHRWRWWRSLMWWVI